MFETGFDVDADETKDWVEALGDVIDLEGSARAQFLINKQSDLVKHRALFDPKTNTPYQNTISKLLQKKLSGDAKIERRIRSYIYWNALAIVLRANYKSNVGGHVSSFLSLETIYDVGFNYFWRSHPQGGPQDFIFFQGHSSPGIYARLFLLKQVDAVRLDNYRTETGGRGLSSYPHPWLMPDLWQFPTVSMGLGPLTALYEAKFLKYLESRQLAATANRRVWVIIGDAEMDEVESRGALAVANYHNLNNLVYIINCNLQGLDGPVRGNYKIIQELESFFIGAGWNVIKVIWGSSWDGLIAADTTGSVLHRMHETLDGDFQAYSSSGNNLLKDNFFNSVHLKKLISNLSDKEVEKLGWGGHDAVKVYNALLASSHSSKPTALLIKTAKGFGIKGLQSANTAHQQKSLTVNQLKGVRDRLDLPICDAELSDLPYLSFKEDSREFRYLIRKRSKLGGCLFRRNSRSKAPIISSCSINSSATNHASTTVHFLSILRSLLRSSPLRSRIVPIVADESRTFGLESLFREVGIWNTKGQNYVLEDGNKFLFYKESAGGQLLQEGINESGAVSSWISAATSYSTVRTMMVPFYIFYSIFGFQRTGDLVWSGGDARARGFLIGGTSGKTTLNGEGLQHADGNSLLLATLVPNCLSFNPANNIELQTVVNNGLKQIVVYQRDVFFYIAVTNEVCVHLPFYPAKEVDIIGGIHCVHQNHTPAIQLIGSGSILSEVLSAKDILMNDWCISASVWSATSFTELNRNDQAIFLWNIRNGSKQLKTSHLQDCIIRMAGPILAVSDHTRLYAEQLRPAMQRNNKCYVSLGADGFGRSDTKQTLREFFGINCHWIMILALRVLIMNGTIDYSSFEVALKRYKLKERRPNPFYL